MIDNRSEKVKDICNKNVDIGCRECCPLAKPCEMKPGDTKEIFDARMNAAAEKLDRPSCFSSKLGNEACFNSCQHSDDCYKEKP